ncbi:MAG: hypothetical protein K2X86_18410 [Cytophagaceae bacterium]|nr:hypothetical protein [Cytophagaceae bacterium]
MKEVKMKTKKRISLEESSQKVRILNLIRKKGPCSSRILSQLSGIERSSITNLLYKLENNKIVKVGCRKECKTTGKLVKFYVLE